MSSDKMEKIVSLCKRRGFVFPGSEIYGGLSNAYDYGPLGVELLRNIKKNWWRYFVQNREDIYGIDGSIISNPKVWEASGHVSSFGDILVDCKECKERFRADHIILDQTGKNLDGYPLDIISKTIQDEKVKCPNCGKTNFTEVRKFNTLFKSQLGSVENAKSIIYLRGETAQNMFLCYKNILDSFSPKIPFGLAQIGKAFRNEITLGNFIFRTFEFEMMEIEYFVREKDWKRVYEYWKKEMWHWLISLGVSEKMIRWRKHTEEELSHYSKRTEDIEYKFPFGGFKELYGLAYRTDFDLSNHSKFSGQNLSYRDPDSGEKFVPHVVEPTFGVSRTLLVILLEAYREEKDDKGKMRVVLKLKPSLAPFKAAVFPLVANKPQLVKKAREVFGQLQPRFMTAWDDIGNIGKRYRRQDEIGTPWCITVDYQTLEDNMVTIRDRDTMEQERVGVGELEEYINERLE